MYSSMPSLTTQIQIAVIPPIIQQRRHKSIESVSNALRNTRRLHSPQLAKPLMIISDSRKKIKADLDPLTLKPQVISTSDYAVSTTHDDTYSEIQ